VRRVGGTPTLHFTHVSARQRPDALMPRRRSVRSFASVRTKNYQPALDLSMYDGIQLRVKGNGLRFKFILRSDANWDTTAYTHSFDTTDGVWETISIPFTAFVRPRNCP
jgi:hypothetical protein